MFNLRQAKFAFAICFLAGLCPISVSAEVPDWVPEEYKEFFHRSSSERPAWKKAFSFVNAAVGETGPSFALVAGVSRYPNMKGKEADLWPARLDVEKMVSYLEREPESFNEIVVLLDEDVTAERLRYFLTRYFPRRLSEHPRSRFLFAYSGHGMTGTNRRGYLLTSQAKDLKDKFGAGISLASLRADFQEVVDTGHHVLALINACYGVGFHRLSLAFGEENWVPSRKGAHAITAGGAGELTWHDPSFGLGSGKKGSVFFEGVFAALDGRADNLPKDGIVTVGELEEYLRSTIGAFTDSRQNPTGGDLISTRSPGNFYFLNRYRQVARNNAKPLDGTWWRKLSFGMSSGSSLLSKPEIKSDNPIIVLSDEAAWSIASREHTQRSYYNYLKLHPKGNHAVKARDRFRSLDGIVQENEEWEEAKSQNTQRSYYSYLKLYPKGKYATEANERFRSLD